MNPRFYTITQVASMTGLTPQQVLDKYPVHRIGNLYRIAESDL
jgi:hypothetical protein